MGQSPVRFASVRSERDASRRAWTEQSPARSRARRRSAPTSCSCSSCRCAGPPPERGSMRMARRVVPSVALVSTFSSPSAVYMARNSSTSASAMPVQN
ncbi:hypothetical protein AB1Y20_004152 [Prymnesium parvum]|uniref:Uncharacterized protein n=1 Tax=Prymnesium parvum TaxID=97485 RepID=A0AB34J909_PRYPA